jgi:hypothetical protein
LTLRHFRLCRWHPPQRPVPVGLDESSALARGRLATGFVAEEFPKGFAARVPEGEVARRIAVVGAFIDHVLGERKRQGLRAVRRPRRAARADARCGSSATRRTDFLGCE